MWHSPLLFYLIILFGAVGWFLTFLCAAYLIRLWLAYGATALWFVLFGLALYWRSVETYDIAWAGIGYVIVVHLLFGLTAVVAWGIGTWLRKRKQI